MDQDEPNELCRVCRRREPEDSRVCYPCRVALGGHLDRLLTRLTELPLHLTPSAAPAGERVATSRTGSPTPARIDVLSLLAHGSRTGNFVPDLETGEPVLTVDQDQVGLTPPREWLARQVETWRAALGHHRPKPRLKPRPEPESEDRLRDDMISRIAVLNPDMARKAWVGRLLVDLYRHGRAQLVTGMSPGLAGDRPAEARDEDPLADEWMIRFGEPTPATAPTDNVRYLQMWLNEACDRDDLDLHRFAAELRSLNAELGRALGERVDAEYLGRCPGVFTDRTTAATGPCGAGLWQDPYASVVTCPRCRTSAGPRVLELIRLAQQIRRVWPLDPRRRYNLDERDNMPDVSCPTCGQAVLVYWRDVTGSQDAWGTWFVPVGVMCPGGCAAAPGLLR